MAITLLVDNTKEIEVEWKIQARVEGFELPDGGHADVHFEIVHTNLAIQVSAWNEDGSHRTSKRENVSLEELLRKYASGQAD